MTWLASDTRSVAFAASGSFLERDRVERMNAVIRMDEEALVRSMTGESCGRFRLGHVQALRLSPCHNPRRHGDHQQSSFRIPSREAGHSQASGPSVRGALRTGHVPGHTSHLALKSLMANHLRTSLGHFAVATGVRRSKPGPACGFPNSTEALT